ncbi:MAG: [LysW]-lysine hydrolase [Anaerolineales bacterium]|nr:[LysW]-lysine hydrolase [Anaerolineales bacterium]
MNVPATLLGLLERYSPSGQEAAAVDFLVGRMAELGFTQAFRDEAGNAVGVMGDGPAEIVLLGHIDTVPGEIPLRVEDGMVYGRGSVDAKGPLAAFVDAVAAIGAQPGHRLVVIAAVDEEGDSAGARHILGRYQPQAAIIGEPSGWGRVTLGYKGSAYLALRVQQPVAHGAAGNLRASEAAVDLWLGVRDWAAEFNAGIETTFDQLQASLVAMASESDGFTETAELQLGFRLPPALGPEELLAQLEAQASGTDAQLIPLSQPIAAFRAGKDNPLVRAFLGAIRAAGGEPRFVNKTGTADMNIAGPAWGSPILAYGPGDAALDHTPHEHLSLAEYQRAVDVLTSALSRLTEAK